MSSNNSLLPREAIALVQHVELNRIGWWEKTVQRLVFAAVWLSDAPPNADAIQATLKSTFRLTLNSSKLTSALASLESNKSLIKLPENVYRIPNEQRLVFEAEIAESEKVETAAKLVFCNLVHEVDQSLVGEEVWTAFQNEFLHPLLKQSGANAFHLIAGQKLNVDKSLIDHFVAPFRKELHQKLRSLVTEYIDPKKQEVCSYLSRMLHARFCVEASGLSQEVLQKLQASIGRPLRFQMFVDTNFLFSLLELHENPSNDAAQELRELITHLRGNVEISFVVTPETIEEAKGSIAFTKFQLSGLPAIASFTKAALATQFSGMTVRFLTERLNRNGKLTAEEWFDPYLNDFVPIARSKGVQLFNEKLDGYSIRQDVIDDINTVFDYEKKLPETRRKSYAKVRHDMMLWHFVNDKRPPYVESPLDVACWILTLDFRLIGFDEHKRKHAKGKVPLCIHPASLVQLLQFWVPRTREFEEAMLGSLRLPFLFQEFDTVGEETSLKILRGIGRFEGNEGLTQETITRVIVNDGLRARLQTEQTEVEEVALIRDSLVEEMRLQSEEESRKAKQLEETVNEKNLQLAALIEQNKVTESERLRLKEENERIEAATKLSFDAQNAEMDLLKGKVLLMEEKQAALLKIEETRKADQSRRHGIVKYCLLLCVIVAGCVVSVIVVERTASQLVSYVGAIWVRFFVSVVVFILCHQAIESSVGRKDWLSNCWLFQQVRRFRGWLWSLVILGFLLGIFGNLVANKIQHNIDDATTPSKK